MLIRLANKEDLKAIMVVISFLIRLEFVHKGYDP